MNTFGLSLAAIAMVAGMSSPATANLADEVNCEDTDSAFCRVTTTGFPLRLLVKPQSNIYFEKDDASAQVRSNIPPFEVLYAFEMDSVSYDENFTADGWFRVGSSVENPEGWMRAEDVVPWKQALALAFTNPGPSERKPVVMFSSADSLDFAIEDFETQQADPLDFVGRVLSGEDVPEGVISREGTGWVDIDQTFYLMPILSHMDLSSLGVGYDLRGVQLAALTNQARSEQSDACDVRTDDAADCFEEQMGGATQLALDAVFVIDMTASMGPYIDAVRNAVRGSTQVLASQVGDDQVRFGLVGYRDNTTASPGIEFVSNNFTPELLPPAEFSDLLTTGGSGLEGAPAIAEATVGSGDTAEEVFAGLETAINSAWSENAGRIIILIGDAPSHPLEHEKNTTGLDEISIREMADQSSIYIASIYVGPEDHSDFAIAKPQFETVASGEGESRTFTVASGGTADALELSMRDVLDGVATAIADGRFESVMSDSISGDDSTAGAVLGAVRAAFVDYLGSDAQPPSNIVAWALDRDLTDYSKKSFDLKVMLTRKDMEELQDLVRGLISELNAGKTTSTDFFGGIQGASSASSYDFEIGDAEKFSASPNLPSWINELPYKSQFLSLSKEDFVQASPDDRSRYESNLNALIDLYDEALNRPDGWVALNEQARVDEKIYMLDLDNLP